MQFESLEQLEYGEVSSLCGAGLTRVDDRVLWVVTLRARRLKLLLLASSTSSICTHDGRLHHHEVAAIRVEVLRCEHPLRVAACRRVQIPHGDHLLPLAAQLHSTLPGARTLAALWLSGQGRLGLLNSTVVYFLPLLLLPLLHF